ncbi:MAG: hypothetical protein AAFQ78_02135, partial [Bacteroidota bacterium]
QLDPTALASLKQTGTCSFDIDEKSFDAEYPGHYLRQIKSISVSFPALVGPYQNVHATLTQTSNKTLLKDDGNGVKYLLGKNPTWKQDPTVLRIDVRSNQQVALSQGINDSGLFQLNFNDERYLPFEGTGAVSSWQLDMPKAYNPIKFESITDVIIRMQYTAEPGSAAFKKTVTDNFTTFGGRRLLSMAQQYANAWHGFINGTASELVFTVGADLLRPNLKDYKVTDVAIMLVLTEAGKTNVPNSTTLILKAPATSASHSVTLTKNGSLASGTHKFDGTPGNTPVSVSTAVDWAIATSETTVTAANVSNMVVVLGYTAEF